MKYSTKRGKNNSKLSGIIKMCSVETIKNTRKKKECF